MPSFLRMLLNVNNRVGIYGSILICTALSSGQVRADAPTAPSSHETFGRVEAGPLLYFDRGFAHFTEASEPGASTRLLRPVVVRREDGFSFRAAIGPEAIVQLAEGASEETFARHGLSAERLTSTTRMYRVKSAGLDGDGIAARLALDDARAHFSIAVPDYYLERKVAAIDVPPDDPRYRGQWFFERLGVEEAWAYSTGSSSVSVTVIDNGCDYTHPDLIAKLDPGRDELDNDDDPTPPNEPGNEHGTACAGLVAASTDNGIGVAGACPECRLRCIRLIGGRIPVSSDVRAFEFAKNTGAAVVSNSWGFVDTIPAPGPLAAAIADITANGRGGLGSVVVFAAGNENREIRDDELNALPHVIAVGALTIFDEATSFSNRGNALDVVSPIGSLTTDIAGPGGHDDSDYTNNFGGTSSACPLVAGIAALLISAKPDATGAEIEEAIISTTRPAPFAVPDENGHDPLYGYGIVSAPHAMRRVLGIEEPGMDAGVADTGIAPVIDAGVDAGQADSGATGPTGPEPAEDEGCQAVRGDGSLLFAGLAIALALLRRVRYNIG